MLAFGLITAFGIGFIAVAATLWEGIGMWSQQNRWAWDITNSFGSRLVLVTQEH
jgi:molybdopterin-containing oxidoreductase family membrane subunit